MVDASEESAVVFQMAVSTGYRLPVTSDDRTPCCKRFAATALTSPEVVADDGSFRRSAGTAPPPSTKFPVDASPLLSFVCRHLAAAVVAATFSSSTVPPSFTTFLTPLPSADALDVDGRESDSDDAAELPPLVPPSADDVTFDESAAAAAASDDDDDALLFPRLVVFDVTSFDVTSDPTSVGDGWRRPASSTATRRLVPVEFELTVVETLSPVEYVVVVCPRDGSAADCLADGSTTATHDNRSGVQIRTGVCMSTDVIDRLSASRSSCSEYIDGGWSSSYYYAFRVGE